MDMQPLEPNKQPPDPNRPMNATLTAREWDVVLGLLFETAMAQRVSRPITDALLRQLQPQLQPLSTSEVMQGLDAPP
jgi:hypothetical protein